VRTLTRAVLAYNAFRKSIQDPAESIAPIGTVASGYSEKGPFRCDRCMHMTVYNTCHHPVVCNDPQVPKNRGAGEMGGAIVKPDACCTYFRNA